MVLLELLGRTRYSTLWVYARFDLYKQLGGIQEVPLIRQGVGKIYVESETLLCRELWYKKFSSKNLPVCMRQLGIMISVGTCNTADVCFHETFFYSETFFGICWEFNFTTFLLYPIFLLSQITITFLLVKKTCLDLPSTY